MITLKLNPFHSVNGEDRGGGEVWAAFEGVESVGRELEVVYLYRFHRYYSDNESDLFLSHVFVRLV